jgi:hypothetical protein
MAPVLHLRFGIILIVDGFVGLTGLLDLAQAMYRFEAALWIAKTDGLRERWVALEVTRVSAEV